MKGALIGLLIGCGFFSGMFLLTYLAIITNGWVFIPTFLVLFALLGYLLLNE